MISNVSLQILQFYAEISGLKINLDKTNVIWIGSKKHSEDKICVKWGLKWGFSTFKLLGITFCVDLDRMLNLNYAPRIQEIEKILQKCQNSHLPRLVK